MGFRVEKIEEKSGNKFILVIGDDSLSIFDYLGVKAWSGLSVADARRYKESKGDAYIAGWTNELPKGHPDSKYSPYFIFLNEDRLEKKYISQVHESAHLARAIMDYKNITDANEEKYVQLMENCYRSIIAYFDAQNEKKFNLTL